MTVEKLVKILGQAGTCRGCGDPIYWVITKNGKKSPLDADGESHFATCPKADRFRTKP